METADPSGLLVLCGLFQTGALLVCARRAGDARDRVGEPRHAVSASRRGRRSALVALAAVALLTLSGGGVAVGPTLLVLVQAALLAWIVPASGDSVLGTRGVRSGWESRGYGEIEEWLLAGDFLRWRLRGEWLACAAPAALHAELRSQLDPARESRHGNAGLDPARIRAAPGGGAV
jgi:hypothetical protein